MRICKECSNEVTGPKEKVFCNRSCAASFNNRKSPKRTRTGEYISCFGCNTEVYSAPWDNRKYCSFACQQSYQKSERIRQWLEEGKDWGIQTPQWAKNYLAERDGKCCSVCKNKKWNGVEIPLESDHIDGNYKNNDENNLRLICPNCHALTDTYKAKNKGNGRDYRRKLH